MSQLKPGYEKINNHIRYLTKQPWLTESQKHWPSYLFHFTDINNAINILSDGFLFSRAEVERKGKLKTDIASVGIIRTTHSKWKNFVRLYFRPRTPMQYSNEGIRPQDKIKYEAHCPVPIVFVFDAREILTLQSTQFSNGNLRVGDVKVGNTVEFYLSLPFKDIYHDTWLSSISNEEKKKIIFHRHAEVIIPEAMDISSLRYIYCRSQAEYETLVNGIPSELHPKWQNKIGIDKRSLFFFCEWLYIEKVSLSPTNIVFYFNQISHSYMFHAHLQIKELETNKPYSWEEKNYKAENKLEFDLTNLEDPNDYEVSFFLDNHLVYKNIYRSWSNMF